MSQATVVIPNSSGSTFRTALNAALAALVGLNSGGAEPAIMYAFMFWADTTAGLLKIRNSANSAWITVGTLASAFLGINPSTTKGDLITFDTGIVRLPVGTDGQVLTADSTQAKGVKWANPANYTIANFTRDSSLASGTASFPHSGSSVPKMVEFLGSGDGAANLTASWGAGLIGGAAGMTYVRQDGGSYRNTTAAGVGLFIDASNFQHGTPSSADATNVTMTWTKTGSPTGLITITAKCFF